MKSFTIQLDTQTKFKQCDLDCLICERPFDDDIRIYKRPAVIVVPGGAYSRVSKREGQPIAMQFLAKGFQAFVLRYHVSPDGASYPDHLIELATAVDYVKKNAESLCVNANEVFVVGFSAGGHLVGNLTTDHKRVNSYVTKQLDCVPTAVGLAYPVKANGQEKNASKLLSNIYLKQAQAANKAKKYQEVIDFAAKSNEALENGNAYKLTASALQKLGKNDECIAAYEKYLEVTPNAKDASGIICTIAVLYQQAGNKAKAKEYYEKIVNDPQFGATAQEQLKTL